MTWTHALIVIVICWIIIVEVRLWKLFGDIMNHFDAITALQEVLEVYMTPKRKSKDQLEKEKDAKRN